MSSVFLVEVKKEDKFLHVMCFDDERRRFVYPRKIPLPILRTWVRTLAPAALGAVCDIAAHSLCVPFLITLSLSARRINRCRADRQSSGQQMRESRDSRPQRAPQGAERFASCVAQVIF